MGKRQEYWAVVAQRALLEALAVSPWSTPMRLIASLFAVAASVVVGWVVTHQISWATMAGFGAVGALVALVWLYRLLWAVPADMNTEASARENNLHMELATYSPAEPDATIKEALGFVVSGEWTDKTAEDLETTVFFLDNLRRLAHSGKLQVFGRLNTFALHKELPKGLWERHGFDLDRYFKPEHPVQTEKLFDDKGNAFRYINLMVVKAQIAREWPKL